MGEQPAHGHRHGLAGPVGAGLDDAGVADAALGVGAPAAQRPQPAGDAVAGQAVVEQGAGVGERAGHADLPPEPVAAPPVEPLVVGVLVQEVERPDRGLGDLPVAVHGGARRGPAERQGAHAVVGTVEVARTRVAQRQVRPEARAAGVGLHLAQHRLGRALDRPRLVGVGGIVRRPGQQAHPPLARGIERRSVQPCAQPCVHSRLRPRLGPRGPRRPVPEGETGHGRGAEQGEAPAEGVGHGVLPAVGGKMS